MENSRLNDMLARYGEVCTQKAAAQILNIVPRTVARMCDEGRLRRVGHLLPEFGLQNLRAIDAAQIQKFVNQFAGTSKSQITQIIGTLKGIFGCFPNSQCRIW